MTFPTVRKINIYISYILCCSFKHNKTDEKSNKYPDRSYAADNEMLTYGCQLSTQSETTESEQTMKTKIRLNTS